MLYKSDTFFQVLQNEFLVLYYQLEHHVLVEERSLSGVLKEALSALLHESQDCCRVGWEVQYFESQGKSQGLQRVEVQDTLEVLALVQQESLLDEIQIQTNEFLQFGLFDETLLIDILQKV